MSPKALRKYKQDVRKKISKFDRPKLLTPRNTKVIERTLKQLRRTDENFTFKHFKVSLNIHHVPDLICIRTLNKLQNRPSRGVLRKKCSKNMQQIYKRTLMPKCGYWNCFSAWVFSCKFAAYISKHLFFRTPLDSCL